MPRTSPLLAVVLFSLLGCAAAPHYQVVQMPLREADLYPLSITKDGVTVAMDEIGSPDRVERYFGTDLLKKRILPVNITISNHSEHVYLTGPADVLLHRGSAVIDPLPLERVVEIAGRSAGGLEPETQERIEAYFSDLAFAETSVSPHSSYQGVLFFPIVEDERQEGFLFSRIALFTQGRLKLEVVATNGQTRERIHFGPFPLSQANLWPRLD